MKKLISLALALVLILSLSTVAFAAEGDTTTDNTVKYTPTTEFTFNEIVKTYNSEDDVVVNETLKFTSTPSNDNPDGGEANLTVADLAVTSLNPGKITVTVPSLSEAGIYNWTIKETAGNTAGVTYSNAEVHVVVLVEYNNETNALQIHQNSPVSYIVKPESGEKMKTFENTFASDDFTVAKTVTGNMADKNDQFEIVVTLTSNKPIGTNVDLAGTTVTPDDWTNTDGSYTYVSTLNYSQATGAKTFSNIPVGVAVSVKETQTADKMNGYTYKTGEEDFTIADETSKAVVITNEKTTNVNTGITMDSMPYILLLSVAVMGLAVLFTKKRMMREF